MFDREMKNEKYKSIAGSSLLCKLSDVLGNVFTSPFLAPPSPYLKLSQSLEVWVISSQNKWRVFVMGSILVTSMSSRFQRDQTLCLPPTPLFFPSTPFICLFVISSVAYSHHVKHDSHDLNQRWFYGTVSPMLPSYGHKGETWNQV